MLSGWRDLAQGCHNYGARLFIQLTPGLGRVGNPQCLITQLKFPVSASLNPNFYISEIPCMPLSGAKLKKIIKNGGQATADAKACGIDGVYLHGHEGYLLEQLTNPAFNRRKLGRYTPTGSVSASISSKNCASAAARNTPSCTASTSPLPSTKPTAKKA